MDILEELGKLGAVLTNKHFVYKSGKHGSGYINMDPIFPDLTLMSPLCYQLLDPFKQQVIDTIAAPATGGIELAVLCAFHWKPGPTRTERGVAIWADKHGDEFVFERAGFLDHIRGKRVLVVEDLLTTGGSVSKVCRLVEGHGGEIVGVSAICNRGGVTAEDLGVPRLECLTEVSFEAVPAEECPLCEWIIPIVEDIGHGAEYKQQHPDYQGGYEKLL